MRTLTLDELRKLLVAVEKEIALLRPGPELEKQLRYRDEIENDIRMIVYADAPSLKPPSR